MEATATTAVCTVISGIGAPPPSIGAPSLPATTSRRWPIVLDSSWLWSSNGSNHWGTTLCVLVFVFVVFGRCQFVHHLHCRTIPILVAVEEFGTGAVTDGLGDHVPRHKPW